MNLAELPTRWRQRAFDPFVPEAVRAAVQACADDLEGALRDRDNALLSPKEAAHECGRSEATIRKWLGNGELVNEGKPGRPKVRRRVLMEKVTPAVARTLRAI